jgi:hypothetical protein
MDVQFVLRQVAEKDVRFRSDSEVTFEVCDGELVMTTTVQTEKGSISGTRNFLPYDLDKLGDQVMPISSRRGSFAPSPMRSPRGSVITMPTRTSKSDEILDLLQAPPKYGRSLSIPQFSDPVCQQKPSIEISHHD